MTLLSVGIAGEWEVLLDTDAEEFGGSGYAAGQTVVEATEEPAHGRTSSISVSLPPLGALFLTPAR